MHFTLSAGVALLASASFTLAQTYTDCNPTKKTCPAAVGLPSSSYSVDFTQGSAGIASWSAATGTTLEYGSDGAVFTIAQSGQAPTIATDFYIFFGHVDVTMRASAGTGIVSSIVLQSADLDEIDWEFLGGDNTQVQSNFYGKGNTTSYDRVVYHPVATPQDTWHTYGIDWTSEKIDFSIDGTVIRTVPYASAATVDGKNFPQTPMQLKLGSWAGGDSSSEGTVEWAGGKTDYSQAPFKMYVKSVDITNYNPACEYAYSDMSGSYQSIDVVTSGDSCKADGASNSSSTASAVNSATATTQSSAPQSSAQSSAQQSSAQSSAQSSVQSSAQSAPTASQVVKPIEQTISLQTTVTGSAYSVNTASISALNSGMLPSATATRSSNDGEGSSSSTSAIASSTGAASLNVAMTGTSLLSILLGAALL